MITLSEQLRAELTESGAALVGFADLKSLPAEQREGLDYGISIAVAFKPETINNIGNGPTKEYYDEFTRLNILLDRLAIRAAEIIKANGFNAFPKHRASVKVNLNEYSTILPHKTVATRAGLGWIGKCGLLVTEEYGSAIRVSSVLTDAPLEVGTLYNESHCGACDHCVRNCPAEALSGELWSVNKDREMFYNHFACRKKALERTWNIVQGETQCGLCILVCPRTRKFIRASGLEYHFPSVDVASKGDLEEILNLQKLAFHIEAERINDFTIAPLTQTLEELTQEAKDSVILKIVEDRKIVGSARAYQKDDTCYIGRVIVHPDYQNKGLGKKLMMAIEKCFRGLRYELFTGHLSEKNLAFYEKLGYRRYRVQDINDNLKLVYLEKVV